MPAHAVEPSSNPATTSQALTLTEDSVAVAVTALFGWSAKESTGSATASFRLRDGSTSSDPRLTATISFQANESDRDWFGDQTVVVTSGHVFLEVVSGSVELVAYLG